MSHRRVPVTLDSPTSRLSIPSFFHAAPAPKIVGCNCKLRWRAPMSLGWEKRLTTLPPPFQSRPRRSQRVTSHSSPNILAEYTVHRLLFHNCGYFDGKVPLDRRYSIPRWLSYLHPLLPILLASPFLFRVEIVVFTSRMRSFFLSLFLPLSLSLLSLNRITELFFQALWTKAVYSHVMERRLPEISGLLSLPLRIRLSASDHLLQLDDSIESIRWSTK